MAATLDRPEAVAVAEEATRRGQIRRREQRVIDRKLPEARRRTT